MRIADHHRERGDDVEFRHAPTVNSVERGMWDDHDRVYASCIFARTAPVASRLLEVRRDAIVGGTGWSLLSTIEDHGITTARQDYSIYPGWRQSIGFTQRGCRLKCEFCVVPGKEGDVKEVSTIHDLWRGDPWPRELLLLDNDFFGQPRWKERIAEIRDGGFKVSFNQGINARMLSEEAAEAIASVDYRDDSMKDRRVYTAWDSREDEGTLFRGLRRLVKHGVSPDHIMVYMLIGYWHGETDDDWLYRQERLREFGCRPYPMPYVRNDLTRGFQRWVVRRADLKVSWQEYKAAHCRPERVEARRMALPLFAGLEGA